MKHKPSETKAYNVETQANGQG
ncbi:hypothetical protein MXD85_12855, partial [Staphylococcus aureus]